MQDSPWENRQCTGKGIIMAAADIGIDLGTSSILVYTKGKGIVLKEPSVVAYDKDADKVKAIGEEARQMIGRTPGNIMAIRPLRQGVISDYTITEKMLKHFIQKAMGRKAFRKPRISICVPSGVTEVERKAVEEATYQAGAREVYIIEEPIAAATDIAVISLGGVVVSASIKVAGNDFDEAIIRHVRKAHNLFIGEQTAEAIKMKIGTVCKRPQAETMEVKGRNVITGLPKTVTVTSEEVREALQECTTKIVEAVHSVLEKTPPELAADIADRGIVLTGGGALLDGFEEVISQRTGINTMTAENPACVVAEGTGRYAEVMEELGK